MIPRSGGVAGQIRSGGLVVAVVGFLLTRFTVTLVVGDDPTRFLLADVVPLVVGLGVAAYGVALAVGDFDRGYAWTVAAWCLLGTASMTVLVALTLYGTAPAASRELAAVGGRTPLSNFLIGGCAGGTLTGVYAARNRRERLDQREQARRMAVLNRVFRDRVLNAVTAVRGHAAQLREGTDARERERAIDVITNQSGRLEETVAELRHLTGRSPSGAAAADRLDLGACVRSSARRARENYPEARVAVGPCPENVTVRANSLVEHALGHLVENAVVHAEDATPRVELSVRDRGDVATVAVSDDGPGLPAAQQTMLERGTVEEFDDPSSGFGLKLAALLVRSFGGEVRAEVTPSGTTVEVDLPVAAPTADADGRSPTPATGVSKPRLALVGVAALVAGAVMGVVGNALTGLVPVIGVLYGLEDPVVGWVTHEFHSVVFGVVYAGILTVAPARYRDRPDGRVLVAVAWGLFLWLFAVGVVTPVWLRLMGIPASLPNLSATALVTHLVWGVALGTTYSAGLAWLTVDEDGA